MARVSGSKFRAVLAGEGPISFLTLSAKYARGSPLFAALAKRFPLLTRSQISQVYAAGKNLEESTARLQTLPPGQRHKLSDIPILSGASIGSSLVDRVQYRYRLRVDKKGENVPHFWIVDVDEPTTLSGGILDEFTTSLATTLAGNYWHVSTSDATAMISGLSMELLWAIRNK